MTSPRSQVGRPLFWLASVMFFLSGSTGLAYQVTWFKRFAHVWGSSSLGFASVTASFLFGLGLGAYWIGRRADGLDRPLRWYGVCELAIAALALVIPFEIQWLVGLSAGYYAHLPAAPVGRYLVQFAITLLVVGPPCVLMGGTLPLMIRELTARDGSLDQATGWLYAINTFGAAAGCLLAGFYLLPKFGLLSTNLMAAALNLTIGLLSLLASRLPRARLARFVPAAASPGDPSRYGSLGGLFIAITLSGLGSLILEMAWGRQLALAVGGSTYAYSAMLFVVLLGIAAGSLVFHVGLRRVASRQLLPIIVIGVLALTCMLGASWLPQLSRYMGLHQVGRITFAGNALTCVSAAAWLELVPALAMGILFPLFVHLTHRTAAAAGRTVGDVYAWNTFGSIAGASLTALLLFPSIGTAGSVALATGLYVCALLLVLPWCSGRQRLIGVACLLAGAGAVGRILVPMDPLLTNLGMYLHGLPKASEGYESVYFAEGASSTVLVSRLNEKTVSLRVNGKADASDNPVDMRMQLGLAYFPRFLKLDATDVLIVGFGSGTTSGASLLFPGTRVTCCEIEPAVYGAAACFAKVNHRPGERTEAFLQAQALGRSGPGGILTAGQKRQIADQAGFRIVFGDGRTFLQGSDERYDLILSEPSNPWIAGVSNLFTLECFAAARQHLKPGGVLAQWIQTYNLSISDYLMIVRTLARQFPHCGVMVLGNGLDTVLLGSEQPLRPTRATALRAQEIVDASPAITEDLRHWFGTPDVRALLVQVYLVDESALLGAVAKQEEPTLNTDLNLRLEFAAPLHLYRPPPAEKHARTQLLALASEQWRSDLAAGMGLVPGSSEWELAEAGYRLRLQKVDEARRHYRNALALDAKSLDAYRGLATADVQAGRYTEAVAVLRGALELKPGDQDLLRSLGDALVAQSRYAEGMDAFRRLLDIDPGDEEALRALAGQLAADGQLEEAARILERLVRVTPHSPSAHGHLGVVYVRLNRSREAAAAFREALALNPRLTAEAENMVWAINLAWILATNPEPELRNGKDAVRWAKQACEVVQYKQSQMVETLAAAYAEIGDFRQAMALTRTCLAQVERDGQTQSIEVFRDRLKLYGSGRPYRAS